MCFGFPNSYFYIPDSVSIFLQSHLSLLPSLYASFPCLSLLRSTLFMHAGLLPPLPDSLHMWMDHFGNFWKSARSAGPFFFPGSYTMEVFQVNPLNRPKSALLKLRVMILLFALFFSCRMLRSNILCSISYSICNMEGNAAQKLWTFSVGYCYACVILTKRTAAKLHPNYMWQLQNLVN